MSSAWLLIIWLAMPAHADRLARSHVGDRGPEAAVGGQFPQPAGMSAVLGEPIPADDDWDDVEDLDADVSPGDHGFLLGSPRRPARPRTGRGANLSSDRSPILRC